MKQQITAIRVASLLGFLALFVIAYWIFSRNSHEVMDTLATLGEQVGGGATYGVFMLALFPPLASFLGYWLTRWILK